MLATKLCSVEGLMLAHADLSSAVRFSTLEQGSDSESCAFKIPHRFSMGFRSGEFPGQVSLSQKLGRLSSHHFWVSFDACAGAPSCWKIGSDIPGTIFFRRTEPVLAVRARLGSRDFCRISVV